LVFLHFIVGTLVTRRDVLEFNLPFHALKVCILRVLVSRMEGWIKGPKMLSLHSRKSAAIHFSTRMTILGFGE
jgi:hypothetical protein